MPLYWVRLTRTEEAAELVAAPGPHEACEAAVADAIAGNWAFDSPDIGADACSLIADPAALAAEAPNETVVIAEDKRVELAEWLRGQAP